MKTNKSLDIRGQINFYREIIEITESYFQKYHPILEPSSFLVTCLSSFSTGVQNVMVKSHTLEGQNLEVKPYYPFFEDTTTKKTEIPFDSKQYNIFRWVMTK